MENASKALLIAGAVLIVILIIGVGMAIFNGAQGSIDSALSQMSAQEQQIFNSQFTSYEGVQTGTKVKTLINTVITNNAQATNTGTPTVKITKDTNVTVTLPSGVTWTAAGETGETQLSALRNAIVSGSNYELTFTQNSGVITTINIKKK